MRSPAYVSRTNRRRGSAIYGQERGEAISQCGTRRVGGLSRESERRAVNETASRIGREARSDASTRDHGAKGYSDDIQRRHAYRVERSHSNIRGVRKHAYERRRCAARRPPVARTTRATSWSVYWKDEDRGTGHDSARVKGSTLSVRPLWSLYYGMRRGPPLRRVFHPPDSPSQLSTAFHRYRGTVPLMTRA